jgi:Uma2 family endonuclease
MACMDHRIDDFCEAAERMPYGAALVMQGLSWDDYERVLEDLQERHLRISYDCGRLEVMSPLPQHEIFARLIDRMVYLYCDEFDPKVESYGNATWKRRSLEKGVEPDACYYIVNAARVIGKRELDLEFDPPPDIVVEIDITNSSLGKFPIYAALGVPEIWRYDRKMIHFYELVGESFTETTQSRFLPELNGRLIAETLEASHAVGQTEALKIFRKQISGSHPK